MKILRCCCFDLRTGTKLIAYIQVVYAIICILMNINTMITPESKSRASAGFGILIAVLLLAVCHQLLKGVKQVNLIHLFMTQFHGSLILYRKTQTTSSIGSFLMVSCSYLYWLYLYLLDFIFR